MDHPNACRWHASSEARKVVIIKVDRRHTVETYDKKSYDKKSRPSIFNIFLVLFFLFFGLWTAELLNFDLKIGFLVQNCIYSRPPNKKYPDSRTKKCNFLSYVSTVCYKNLESDCSRGSESTFCHTARLSESRRD